MSRKWNTATGVLRLGLFAATAGAACSSGPEGPPGAGGERIGTTQEAIVATGFAVAQSHTVLPTHFGGRATAVSISPTAPANAFVATDGGGMFKTTNGGTTWTHLEPTTGLLPFRMGDVRYNPANANVLVATAAGDTRTVNAGGIWRSTNGGATWTQPPTATAPCSAQASAFGIAYGPGTANVYVGTSCGLAISSDSGATWRHINPTPGTTSVQSVIAQAGGIVDILGADGHHRSRDNGATWTATSTLPKGTVVDMLYLPNAVLHALSGAPTSSQILFATLYDTDAVAVTLPKPENVTIGGQIFESDNGGSTWTNISRNLGSVDARDYDANGRPPFVKTRPSADGIAAHFDIYWGDTDDLAVQTCTATSGTKCTVAGWRKTNMAHSDNNDIDWATGSDNCPRLMTGDGGVQNSPDCGTTWQMLGSAWNSYNALQLYQVTGQTLNATSDYYFGTQDNSFYASTNAGATWTSFGNEGRKLQIPHHLAAATGAGQIVSEEYGGGIGWINYDGTPSNINGWDNDNAGVNHQDPADPTKQILTPPVVPGHVAPLVVTAGQYVEWATPTYNGPSDLYITKHTMPWTPPAYNVPWTKVSGSTISMVRAGSAQLSGPATSPTLYQGVVRADGSHGLVKVTNFIGGGPAAVASVDTGLVDIGEGGSEFDEWMWAVDPNDPNHLVAADVGAGQMMVTTNGGASWVADARATAVVTGNGQFRFSQGTQAFGQPHKVSEVGAIAFDPTNGKRVLIGTVEAGIVASLDGAQTWVSVPGSQQIPSITSFFFDERAKDVLVSSYGRGLWTLTMPAGGFCGSLQTTACTVTVSGSTTKYTSLQTAINAAPNGATLTVSGRCNEHPTVSGRSNLTIQGTAPAGGCAALGPSMTDLSATVQGLDVVGSTGITVRYLNLVDSTTNGLLVSASAVVPSVNCNCIARSTADGLAINAAAVNGATQNLIVSNTSGVDVVAATALGISSNTIQSNRWEGVTLLSTAAASITGNLVQGNTQGGVFLTTSSGNVVDGNTINGNGDGLTNLVTCAASVGNLGSNIPLLCL